MIKPPCGFLVQAWCILGDFCFHHLILCLFSPVLNLIKTKAIYLVVFET